MNACLQLFTISTVLNEAILPQKHKMSLVLAPFKLHVGKNRKQNSKTMVFYHGPWVKYVPSVSFCKSNFTEPHLVNSHLSVVNGCSAY